MGTIPPAPVLFLLCPALPIIGLLLLIRLAPPSPSDPAHAPSPSDPACPPLLAFKPCSPAFRPRTPTICMPTHSLIIRPCSPTFGPWPMERSTCWLKCEAVVATNNWKGDHPAATPSYVRSSYLFIFVTWPSTNHTTKGCNNYLGKLGNSPYPIQTYWVRTIIFSFDILLLPPVSGT